MFSIWLLFPYIAFSFDSTPTLDILRNSTCSNQYLQLKWTFTSPNPSAPGLFEFATLEFNPFTPTTSAAFNLWRDQSTPEIFEFRTLRSYEFSPTTITTRYDSIHSVVIMLRDNDWNTDFEFRIGFDFKGECKWTATYSISMQSLLDHCMTCINDDVPSQWMYRAPLYAAIGVTSAAAATVALPMIGFTAGGVAAGSIAASIHSNLGVVGAGTAFATLQSIGALGGLSTTTAAGIGAVSAALSGIFGESSAKKEADPIFGADANLWKKEQISNEVKEWFENEVKFRDKKDGDKYSKLFVRNGFDSLDIIQEMNEKDLDAMGIMKRGHRIRLLRRIKDLKRRKKSFYDSMKENVEDVLSNDVLGTVVKRKWKNVKKTFSSFNLW